MLIQAPVDKLREAMRHADGLGRLDIQVDGETGSRKAIVKHVESDALRHELVHVTLQEVTDDDQVKMDIPVVASGEPAAMAEGDLLLTAVTDHLKLRGRLADMPSQIEVDVTTLEAGHHIEAKDVTLPEGIELLSSPEATLFSLRVPQLVLEEPTETEETTEEGGGTTDAASDGEDASAE
jgi:large subunit ribosomal protein L25